MVLAGGGSKAAHMRQAAKSLGLSVEVQETIEAPPGMELALVAFEELHSARGSTGFGINPISYTELDAWARLRGLELQAWQVDVIRLLDRTYLEVVHARLSTIKSRNSK